MSALELHIDNLIARFGNRELHDPATRVARDPVRKMAAHDRVLGPCLLAITHHTPMTFLGLTLALGVHDLSRQEGWDRTRALAHVQTTLAYGAATSEVEPLMDHACQFITDLDSGWSWNHVKDLIDASSLQQNPL